MPELTHLERFKRVVHFEETDYVPIFGLRGAGFAHGAFVDTHRRLVETGIEGAVRPVCQTAGNLLAGRGFPASRRRTG